MTPDPRMPAGLKTVPMRPYPLAAPLDEDELRRNLLTRLMSDGISVPETVKDLEGQKGSSTNERTAGT